MRRQLRNFPFFSAVILLALVIRLTTSGLSWVGIVALVIALFWFGFELIRWLIPEEKSGKKPSDKSGKPSPKPNDNLVSLVYFLSDPKKADEDTVRSCVESALGFKFESDNPEAEHFVMPFRAPDSGNDEDAIQHFMVKVPQGLYAVLVATKPYIDDPVAFAKESIKDKRLRNAVQEHQAWLSVDLMDDTTDPDKVNTAYSVIGKILASMAGPDCLAIYCPELQRCNEFDLGLIEVLSSTNPLALFEEPTFEPVIEIADNDPRMAAAVETAVNRWPEFREAYENCSPDEASQYIVKAEFIEGRRSEFMWITVTEITDDEICGVLMNDPHELMEVHRGVDVRIPMNLLNDWLYPGKDGDHIGGFTLDVLADSAGDE
ncbi:MAG: DUF2314 domain-containing protein [Verrucomicrobiales bacterium]|nr:DUF2314 domain-containing protein [Verrucomicrobiales bacterium]